jgi:hypothetical protein
VNQRRLSLSILPFATVWILYQLELVLTVSFEWGESGGATHRGCRSNKNVSSLLHDVTTTTSEPLFCGKANYFIEHGMFLG